MSCGQAVRHVALPTTQENVPKNDIFNRRAIRRVGRVAHGQNLGEFGSERQIKLGRERRCMITKSVTYNLAVFWSKTLIPTYMSLLLHQVFCGCRLSGEFDDEYSIRSALGRASNLDMIDVWENC